MKFKENKWFWYGICAVLLAALVLIGILSIPSKRIVRLINRAEKQYASMDYEKAENNYKKALKLDPVDVKAARGYVLCCMNRSSEASLDAFKDIVENLYTKSTPQRDFTFLEEDKEDWIDFFLLAPEISKGSEDYYFVKEGYDMLSNPAELKPALSDACLEWGKELFEEGTQTSDTELWNDALNIYLECLEYSDGADSYSNEILKDVKTTVNEMISIGDFVSASDVAEAFETVYKDEYSSEINRIKEAEKYFNVKESLLSKVYEAMKPYYFANKGADLSEVFKSEDPVLGMLAKNWDEMLLLDGSEEADTLAYSMYDSCYIYKPSENGNADSSIGCGLYPYGEVLTAEDGSKVTGYYFYIGEYENGQRNGYGISFAKRGSTSFVAYEGQWKNDAPFGIGISYECNMYAHTSLAEYRRATCGNFSEGLEDGLMATRAVLNEHPDTSFYGTYTATRGVVAPLEGDPLDYGIVDSTPEGYSLVAIIPSVDAGYDYFLPLYVYEGSTMGAIGY